MNMIVDYDAPDTKDIHDEPDANIDVVEHIVPNDDHMAHYSTIQTDREYLRKHLTKETVKMRRQSIMAQAKIQVVPKEVESPTISESNSESDRQKAWSMTTPVPVENVASLKTIMEQQEQSNHLSPSHDSASSHLVDDRCSILSDQSPSGCIERTRLCIYGKKCKNIAKCLRAHTLREWQPNVCRFNKRCKNNKCLYYHQGDDKRKYLETIINSEKESMSFYSKSKNKTLYMKSYEVV
jgi:hypothetical protein